MKVYFISGLGADRRVFSYIQLPEHCHPVFLDWLKPGPKESLETYAMKMAGSIDTAEPFALVGLSIGGMMVSEIAKIYPPLITVLISSVPVYSQLPPYFKMAAGVRLHKLIPPFIYQSASMTLRFFSPESAEIKALLMQIVRESDPDFIRWGIQAVPEWKNQRLPDPYVHIHGTNDIVLPIRYTKPTHVIQGAGHLLVMNNAASVNTILKDVFSKYI